LRGFHTATGEEGGLRVYYFNLEIQQEPELGTIPLSLKPISDPQGRKARKQTYSRMKVDMEMGRRRLLDILESEISGRLASNIYRKI
jgi:hypothetical protein